VDERARGTGLGRALVAATLDRARARGCRRVELDVNEANATAQRLYESFGFSSTSNPYRARDLYMRRHVDGRGAPRVTGTARAPRRRGPPGIAAARCRRRPRAR